jgi:hypothetical protein
VVLALANQVSLRAQQEAFAPPRPPYPVETTSWTAYIPWSTLLWVLVGVPLVIGLAATAGSGLRTRWRPIAASRFSFD